LPAEIQKIVILHWELDGSAGRPVHAIAREIGRTSAEVRALLQDALGFLRNRVTAAVGGSRHPWRQETGSARTRMPVCQRRAADALSGSPAAFGNGDADGVSAPIPLRGGGRHP
jgi:hypothetical protein